MRVAPTCLLSTSDDLGRWRARASPAPCPAGHRPPPPGAGLPGGDCGSAGRSRDTRSGSTPRTCSSFGSTLACVQTATCQARWTDPMRCPTSPVQCQPTVPSPFPLPIPEVFAHCLHTPEKGADRTLRSTPVFIGRSRCLPKMTGLSWHQILSAHALGSKTPTDQSSGEVAQKRKR